MQPNDIRMLDVRFTFRVLDPALADAGALFTAVAKAVPGVIPSTKDERDEGACLIDTALQLTGEHVQEAGRRIAAWLRVRADERDFGSSCAWRSAADAIEAEVERCGGAASRANDTVLQQLGQSGALAVEAVYRVLSEAGYIVYGERDDYTDVAFAVLRAAVEASPVVPAHALRAWIDERREADAPSVWVAEGIVAAACEGYEAALDDLAVLLDGIAPEGEYDEL